MLNFMYMVGNVITELFTQKVGKWQGEFGTDGKPTDRKALLIHFTIKKDRVQMLVHADNNYVGVFIRSIDTSCFKCISYHDSCWRNDGVESFLWQHQEDIHFCSFPIIKNWDVIEKLTDAIHIVRLDAVQLDALKQIRNANR